MRRIVITPLAFADFNGVWDHIAKDSSFYATRYTDRLTARIEKLADLPQLGHIRSDIFHDDIRCYTERSHMILYTFDDQQLIVLRIVHGARNLPEINLH